MPLSLYSLDKFVSQKLSEFTKLDLPDVYVDFPQSPHWLGNFILNSIFRHQLDNKPKQFFFVFIRRSEMAFYEYAIAKIELKDYLLNRTTNISKYFSGLYHIELTLSNLYQSYESFMRFSKEKLFSKDDGSEIQRLNRFYNIIKHIEYSSMPEENLHPIWLNNDGMHCESSFLGWNEIINLLKDVGKFADKLSRIDFEN
jgi:hypothetical protein